MVDDAERARDCDMNIEAYRKMIDEAHELYLHRKREKEEKLYQLEKLKQTLKG